MSFYRTELENYLKTLHIRAHRVLDIGGSANPVINRVKTWNVEDYRILDSNLEKEYQSEWTDANISASIEVKDIWKYVKRQVGAEFGYIFCLEVMEYVIDPMAVLENIYALLYKNGEVIITFPFVYPMHEPKEMDSLRYTKYGVERLLKNAGFSEWKIIPRHAKNELLMQYYMSDGMHPAKGIGHDITGWIVEAKK